MDEWWTHARTPTWAQKAPQCLDCPRLLVTLSPTGGKGRAVSKQESDVLEDAMARVVRAGEAAASKDVVNIERAARQVDRRPTNKKTPKKAKGFKARAA